MEEVLCGVWEIAVGYFLLGMVENRKDDCSYPKGLCADRHLEILLLGSGEGQEGTRKASRCAMYRNRQNYVFQENTLCGLCPQLF